ncbi:MAG: caspase family protein [Terracidiphilus sp.]
MSAFGDTQSLPIPEDFSGMHSIPLGPQIQIQKIASSNNSRVVAVIAHGLAPSPFLLLLVDGILNTKLAEFSLSADPPRTVCVSGDGGTVAVGYVEGLVRLWNVGTKSELPSIHTLQAVSSPNPMIGATFLDALCLSQDGSHLFIAQVDTRGEIASRNGQTQPIVTQLPAQAGTCAFDPSGKFIAIGAGGSELLKGVDGKSLWSRNDGTAPISYVTFREDGKELLFVDANGVHVRGVEAGDITLSFTAFKSSSQTDWIAWSPTGHFDGSQEGIRHLRYAQADKSSSPLPIDALVRDYYQPGLVGNLLRGSVSAPTGSEIPASSCQTVRLRQEHTHAQSVDVAVDIMASNRTGHASVRLFRNGLLVRRWQSVDLANSAGPSLTATVALLPGTNHLLAYSYDDNGIESADAEIDCEGPDTVEPGTLHVLSVGINQYQNNRKTTLNWAEADAQLMAQVLAAQRAQINREEAEMRAHPEMRYSPADRAKFERSFGPVEVTVLPSDQASRENILSKIAEIAARAKPQDTVVLFFAGHGTTRNGTFYFLASDIAAFDLQYALDTVPVALLSQGSVSDRDLEAALEPVDAGNIALVVDACESGQLLLTSTDVRRGPVDAHGFAQLAFEKGIALLAATPNASEAQEGARIGHGWLTYDLGFEGLQNGKARVSDIDGDIYLDALFRYAAEEVPKHIAQQPIIYLPKSQNPERALLGFGAVKLSPGAGRTLPGDSPPPNPLGDHDRPSLGELTVDGKEQPPALITFLSFEGNQLVATLAEASRIDQTRWSDGDPTRKTLALNWSKFYLNSQPDIVAQERNGQYVGIDLATLTTYALPEAWKSEANVAVRKASSIGVVQSQANSSNASLQVWDISKNRLLWSKENSYLGSIAISADGKLLALNTGREVLLVESDKGNSRSPSVAFPFQAPFDGFQTAALSEDGALLATAASGGNRGLTIWNLTAEPSDRVIWTAQPQDTATELKFFSTVTDGSFQNVLAAALVDGTISVYQWQTEAPAEQFQSGGHAVSILSFSPDGTVIAAGTADGVISLFDLKQHSLLLRLRWIESADTWITQDGAGHFDAPRAIWHQLSWSYDGKISPVQSSQHVESLATKVLQSRLNRQ